MHPDEVGLLHSVWMQHFGGLFALEELVCMLQERSVIYGNVTNSTGNLKFALTIPVWQWAG